jgi:hypothetical protein
MQLWISDLGIAQIPSTPEARLAHSMEQQTFGLIVPILLAGASIFGSTATPWLGPAFAALVVVTVAVALWRAPGQQRQ